MNLILFSILMIMAVVLIVLIIKENIAYKKEFKASLKREYNSRLKDELESLEDQYLSGV